MTNNIIKILSDDELASVIDKILTRKEELVFLEVPADAYIAQNVLNFQLLKREAESASKNLVIISSDPRIQSLAAKASLRVRDQLPDASASLVVAKTNQENNSARPNIKKDQDASRPVRQMADIIAPNSSSTRKSKALNVADLSKEKTKQQQVAQTEPQPSPFGRSAEGRQKEEPAPKQQETPKESLTRREEKALRKQAQSNETGRQKRSGGIFPKLLSPFKYVGAGFVLIYKKTKSAFSGNPKKATIAALIFVLVAILLHLGINVLPRTTVVLNPESVVDTMDMQLLADSNVSSADFSKGVLPSQVLEEKQESTFTFTATGSEQVEEHATGTITVYNEHSSDPQTLVANTRFASSDGKIFRTTQTILVPGANVEGGKIVASSIDVSVRADEPGKEHNIGPSTFSIPGFRGTDKFLGFFGKSESQMTGGFVGTKAVVTKEDTENAEERIKNDFLPKVAEDLRNKVPDNFIILDESFGAELETLDINLDVNEPANTFTARAVGVARAFILSEQDINGAISYTFVNSTEYSAQYDLSDKREIDYNITDIDYDAGTAKMQTQVRQIFNRKMDAELLAQEIRGKSEVEVRRILQSKEELLRAQLKFWPFWVKTVPNDEEKITVELEYTATLD